MPVWGPDRHERKLDVTLFLANSYVSSATAWSRVRPYADAWKAVISYLCPPPRCQFGRGADAHAPWLRGIRMNPNIHRDSFREARRGPDWAERARSRALRSGMPSESPALWARVGCTNRRNLLGTGTRANSVFPVGVGPSRHPEDSSSPSPHDCRECDRMTVVRRI